MANKEGIVAILAGLFAGVLVLCLFLWFGGM